MEQKKSKLSEIRATAVDAVVIMRLIGNPEVLASLGNVKDTASTINEIIRGLSTPEMVKNIENFRIISENINEVSSKVNNTVNSLQETGIMEKTVGLIDSAKTRIDSDEFSENIESTVKSTQEMFASISGLINEITLTVSDAKKSQTVSNIQESIRGASEIYDTVSS